MKYSLILILTILSISGYSQVEVISDKQKVKEAFISSQSLLNREFRDSYSAIIDDQKMVIKVKSNLTARLTAIHTKIYLTQVRKIYGLYRLSRYKIYVGTLDRDKYQLFESWIL